MIDTRLDNISVRLDEVVDLLKAMNGRTREHGELLAAHGQWLESHQQVHEALDKRIDQVSLKTNVIAGVNALLALYIRRNQNTD